MKLKINEDIDSSLYDADAIANAYIANLGKYVEGELVGGWIALPTDEETINKFLKDVVKLDDRYEECAIHDWESDYIEYPGEYANIYELNDKAKIINDLDEYDLEVYKAANEVFGDIDPENFDAGDYWYFPDCHTDEDIAYEYIESIGSIEDAVAHPEDYIDEDRLRRDISFDEESIYRDDYESENGEEYDEDDFQDAFEHYLDMLMEEILYSPQEFLGDNLTNYFDYDQFGRNLRMDCSGDFFDGGFIAQL